MKLSEPKLQYKVESYKINIELTDKMATYLLDVIYFYGNPTISSEIGYISKIIQIPPRIRFKTSEKKAIRKAIEEKINNLKK